MVLKRLKQLREEREADIWELAALLEVTAEYYKYFERGTVDLRADGIKKLAQYYHVPTDYILELTDNPNRREEEPIMNAQQEEETQRKAQDRIKALREEAHLSCAEIAKIVGKKEYIYKQYEDGEKDFPAIIIAKLAFLYNLSTDYLSGITDDPKKLIDR